MRVIFVQIYESVCLVNVRYDTVDKCSNQRPNPLLLVEIFLRIIFSHFVNSIKFNCQYKLFFSSRGGLRTFLFLIIYF